MDSKIDKKEGASSDDQSVDIKAGLRKKSINIFEASLSRREEEEKLYVWENSLNLHKEKAEKKYYIDSLNGIAWERIFRSGARIINNFPSKPAQIIIKSNVSKV